MQIFSANMDKISRHNARYMKGEVTYSMGMNQFGDLTTEEFSKLHKATEFIDASAPVFTAPADYQPHASVDWRDYGYVSGVKDQGSCGSCWSFLNHWCFGRNVGQENRPNGPHERTEPYGLLHSKLWMQRWSCTVRSQLRKIESRN